MCIVNNIIYRYVGICVLKILYCILYISIYSLYTKEINKQLYIILIGLYNKCPLRFQIELLNKDIIDGELECQFNVGGAGDGKKQTKKYIYKIKQKKGRFWFFFF